MSPDRHTSRYALAALLALIAPLALGAADADPGLLIEVDREQFVLTARDLRDDVVGPTVRVAIGSPMHETPAGTFPLYSVVHHPGWSPAAHARKVGARHFDPSPKGPMGVAKLPFGAGGYALHGGGHRVVLGKPVSRGCVRLSDADMLGLIAWLEERAALGREVEQSDGERHQGFRRRAKIVIH